MADAEIKWHAPEFEEQPKGIAWYWLSVLISVAFLGVAVWQRNFLFGFFVVIAEILVLVWGNRTPQTVEFTLSDKGVSVGNGRFFSFREIEYFSADERGEWPKVVLRFKSRLRPPLTLPTPKAQWNFIVRGFRLFLPQTEHEESLLDALQKFLGF